MTAKPYRPLDGIRVLDIGILVPAPLCTVRLAQLGADVVKVEAPVVGDRLRHLPGTDHDNLGAFYVSINRGSRSIAADLRTEEGRELFFRLAAVTDVIVENAMPGRWAEMGIDFAALRERRPELIVCSITGYGQTGPLSSMPSHGLNMDALAGSMIVDERDGHYGFYVDGSGANELGTIQAAFAISAALFARERTGEGAWIDISCWDAAVEARRAELVQAAVDGAVDGTRADGFYDLGAFYAPYRTADDKFVLLGTLEPKFWRNFCHGIGREDLVGAHGGGEIEMGATDNDLRAEIQGVIETATADEWEKRFVEWDVPGCPILTRDEVFHHPHLRARGLLEGVGEAEWPNVTSPIRWHHTGERAGAGVDRVARLDADAGSILADWLGG